MKKDKKFRQMLMWMISSVITLLGFSGCGNIGEPQPDMYGSPYVDFEIKGKVTDEKGNAVKDALISMKGKFSENQNEFHWVTPIYESPEWQKYAIYSNDKGTYEIKQSSPYSIVRVICTPAETSGLAADSVELKITYNRDKNDSWYMVSYSGTVNFKLKEKKN